MSASRLHIKWSRQRQATGGGWAACSVSSTGAALVWATIGSAISFETWRDRHPAVVQQSRPQGESIFTFTSDDDPQNNTERLKGVSAAAWIKSTLLQCELHWTRSSHKGNVLQTGGCLVQVVCLYFCEAHQHLTKWTQPGLLFLSASDIVYSPNQCLRQWLALLSEAGAVWRWIVPPAGVPGSNGGLVSKRIIERVWVLNAFVGGISIVASGRSCLST